MGSDVEQINADLRELNLQKNEQRSLRKSDAYKHGIDIQLNGTEKESYVIKSNIEG